MSSRGSVDQKAVDKINVLFKTKDATPGKKGTQPDDELKAFIDFVDKKGAQNIDAYNFSKPSHDKSVTMRERSMGEAPAALYAKQRPMVVLDKFRQDLEDSEVILEKLIEGKISKNRFVMGRDLEVQVRD